MYRQFADLYGWTPDQVDNLTLDQQYWLPVMDTAKSIAAEQLSD